MQYILIIATLFALSNCMDIATNTTYNKSLTASRSESEEIRLSFHDHRKAPFYFVLMSNTNDTKPHVLLKVRWVNIDKNYRQFDRMKSTLKFIINKEHILSFTPIKEPQFVFYDINNNSREEEAIYRLSREEVKELAFANTVDVELQGKYVLVIGKFNKWYTFRAFKHFINNT